MRSRYVLAALASSYIVTAEPSTSKCSLEENGLFYNLAPLQAKKDYVTQYNGRDFTLNVCTSVVSDAWHLANQETVAAYYRGDRSDLSIGSVNTTLRIADSNPVLELSDGALCGGEGSSIRAATVIRFICDNNVFGAGKPQVVAQLPPGAKSPCSFFFEWRTHLACPTARPNRAGGVVSIIAAAALILLVSYIIAGILYRRFALGYRGFDQIPRISLIPLSAFPRSLEDLLDWLRDIRDHIRGGVRDLWPRSSATAPGPRASSWARRNGGFAPLAREEEQAMFRDGPDGPDARFSLEDETDLEGARELVEATPPVPSKGPGNDAGPIRL